MPYDQPVIFIGEGLNSYAADLQQAPPGRAVIAPALFRICRAGLVAICGQRLLAATPLASYLELLPRY